MLGPVLVPVSGLGMGMVLVPELGMGMVLVPVSGSALVSGLVPAEHKPRLARPKPKSSQLQLL